MDHFTCSASSAAAINNQGNTIYLCAKKGQITIFELKNDNECEMRLVQGLEQIKYGAPNGSGIMIKNEFHIIGGYFDNKHLKYSPNSNGRKCDIMHE